MPPVRYNSPVNVTTPHGTLTITGYNGATGVIDYTYTLREAVTHGNADGNNATTESLEIKVTDVSDDARIDTLNITIIDDVPTAADPTPASVVEGATVYFTI